MIASDLQARTLLRLGEDPNAAAGNQYYTGTEVLAALNSAQRLMALLTLCLETNGTLSLTANTAFYSLLSVFPDLLLPLRIRMSSGVKLKPSRLSDFAALDASWSTTTGTPDRYALLGFDFLAVYMVPNGLLTSTVTYARCPDAMALPGDVPEVPAEFHPALIDGAIPLLRVKEGGQELQKVMSMFDRFLDACQKLADYVRARNKEQGYDYMPVEIQRFDRSKLLMQPAKGAKVG